MRIAAAVVSIGLAVIAGFAVPVADAHPSEPGVVSYAVLGKGSVGNIVGAPMGWEAVFTRPFQAFWVELPACNNWVDIGLPGCTTIPTWRRSTALPRRRPPPTKPTWSSRRLGYSPATMPQTGRFTALSTEPWAARGRPPRSTWTTGRRRCGRSPVGRRPAPTRPGPNKRPAPIDDALFKPGCAKTYCCRPRSVSPATPVPRSTCWPGQCRTHWAELASSFARRGGRQDKPVAAIVLVAAQPTVRRACFRHAPGPEGS